jgi:hypothetical protein
VKEIIDAIPDREKEYEEIWNELQTWEPTQKKVQVTKIFTDEISPTNAHKMTLQLLADNTRMMDKFVTRQQDLIDRSFKFQAASLERYLRKKRD